MTVVKEGGRDAVTDYEVLERFGRFSVVRANYVQAAPTRSVCIWSI